MSDISNFFEPVETKRASEAIYEQIKERIISGDLKPGDRLPSERNMMELFRRSRPTIREALRMLERSGYIRTIPGSNGAVITSPNEKNMEESIEDALQIGQISLEEMREYRCVSEGATAQWAAERATDDEIKALEECLAKMAEIIEDHDKFIDMDAQFHALLASAAKNRVSVTMNTTLNKLSRTFVKRKMSDLSAEDRSTMGIYVHKMHVEIFEAVKAHDVEKARAAMDKHLNSFYFDLS